ncbi:MAG: FAD-dependent oxidoreductase, partial [Patescibacteria group bacterium]
ADTIREQDKDGEITLISGEVELVYNRIVLPNYLKGRIEREKLFIKTPEALAAKNINVKAGVWVKSVDVVNRAVILDNGESLPFDKLLIATGGRPKKWNVPGADKQGVFHFQTLEDSDAILEYAKNAKSAVVVGGGFISLELIDAFIFRKLETHLFLRRNYYWPDLMDEEQSMRLVHKIEAMGVFVHPNQIVSEVLGDSKATGVKTEQGLEVEADLMAYGIGLDNYTEFLAGSNIKTNQGVIVNQFLESSIPGIYAAGDVAEYGRVLGNWDNAKAQGKVAGLNMAGLAMEFNDVPYYSMSVGGLLVATLGNTDVKVADKIEVRKDENKYVKILMKNGKVIGAIFVGGVEDVMGLKKAITGAI